MGSFGYTLQQNRIIENVVRIRTSSNEKHPQIISTEDYIQSKCSLFPKISDQHSLFHFFYSFISWQTYISGMNDYHYQYEAQGFKVGLSPPSFQLDFLSSNPVMVNLRWTK